MQDLYNKLNDRITGNLHLTAKWELSDLVLTAQADNEANGKLGAINLDWSTYDNYNIIFKGYSSKDNGTSWDAISLMDYTNIETVKVLQIYPASGASNQLKQWMETNGYGKGIIKVDSVYIDTFNSNPYAYLTTDGSSVNENWKYDVIFFGTWDSNGSKGLNATSKNATEKFILSGRGCIFGHDTISWDSSTSVAARSQYFNQLAPYVNIVGNGYY